MSQTPRFTVENQLLIAASRLDDRPLATPADGLDWAYVAAAAERQGVGPLLYQWLQRHPECAADADVRKALHEVYWHGHFRNRLFLAELDQLATAATNRGLALMPLKGALLAPQYYEQPALRPLSDIDLLVHPKDLAPFAALLREQGYAETGSSPSYVDDEWLDLDSQDYGWFASRVGFDSYIEYRVAPLELAVGRLTDLDADYTRALRDQSRDVWTRASRSRDGALWLQSPEDLLLHVATHMAAKHLHFRLIWLRDLALIVQRPGLDWSYVASQSARLRMAAPIIAALEAARQYVGAPITDAQIAGLVATLGPASSLSLVHRDLTRLRAHVQTLPHRDLRNDGPWGWPLLAALSRVHGWPARLRILRWVVLPGADYLAHRGTAGTGVIGSLKRLVRRG